MIIDITFTAEPGDDEDMARIGGYAVHMEGVETMSISTGVDIVPGEKPGEKYPLPTGNLEIKAHGNRAEWSQK